jgi:hypothetical protein
MGCTSATLPTGAEIKALPPPPGAEVDLGEGFPSAARHVIEEGERALVDLRKNSVERWIAVGAALKTLRNAAMNRSGSNQPAGRRYNRVYTALVHAWPQLTKVDKRTRSHAIWLFEQSEIILAWLATVPQNQRDQWTHPTVVRRHFEKRHPSLVADPPTMRKLRPPRTRKAWNRQSLGQRSREDLQAIIAELDTMLADRDREIADLNDLVEEQRRKIEQLTNDLAWERESRRQLEAVAAPSSATVVRPNGETVEIVHAISRESQEVSPPLSHGHPDYAAWAKQLVSRIDELSAMELRWLLIDNDAHLEAYEAAFPGAGVALEDRIARRIAELERAG